MAHGRMGSGDPCLRIVGENIWRATRTPAGPATQRVSLVSHGCVQVGAWGPGAAWVLERAAALCGELDHPETFQPEQPFLHHLMRCHPGLRIGRSEAVFETALFVALEQRVATRDGIERRRADILRRMALVARRLEETAEMTLDAAYARLTAITGIGPWTAGRIAMLALGDCDAVFVGDLHLPHLVSSALAGERRGTDERMLELLEPYRGHRARVVRLLLAGAR